MKHTTKFLLVSVLGCLAAGFAGCAESTPEIYIKANQPFDDECQSPTSAAGTTTFVSRGVLDLFLSNEYVMAPLVQNTLVPSTSVSFGAAGGGAGGGLTGNEWEANSVSLTHAIVRFNAPDALGVPLLSRIEIPLSGSMEPGGFAGLTLVPITANIGNVLSQSTLLRENLDTTLTLELGLTFHGRTAGGVRVDSNEFVYPVDLCFGCLVDIPTEAVDRDFPLLPNCRGGLAEDTDGNLDTSQFTEDICFVGQDDIIDCRAVCPIIVDDINGDQFGICEPTL